MNVRVLLALVALTAAQLPAQLATGTTKVASLYDPWGTYIELTQGLAPAK